MINNPSITRVEIRYKYVDLRYMWTNPKTYESYIENKVTNDLMTKFNGLTHDCRISVLMVVFTKNTRYVLDVVSASFPMTCFTFPTYRST